MNFTIHDLHAQLVNKEISAVELTKKVIAHRDSVEKDVHAYLSLSDAKALEKAAEVDAKIAAGEEISDPPVSEPRAQTASIAATAAAEPPEEPPGT